MKDKTLEKVELTFQGFHSMGFKLIQRTNPSSEGLSIEELVTDDTQKSMIIYIEEMVLMSFP